MRERLTISYHNVTDVMYLLLCYHFVITLGKLYGTMGSHVSLGRRLNSNNIHVTHREKILYKCEVAMHGTLAIR